MARLRSDFQTGFLGASLGAGRSITDAQLTSGSPTLNSVQGNFTAADIGTPIVGNGIPANTYVGTVTAAANPGQASSLGLSSSSSSNVPVNATASGTGVWVTLGASTLTFGVAPTWPSIVNAGDYRAIVLEPTAPGQPPGNAETVWLIAPYTAGSTTGTVMRAMEGTPGNAHNTPAMWTHTNSSADLAVMPLPVVDIRTPPWNVPCDYQSVDDAIISSGSPNLSFLASTPLHGYAGDTSGLTHVGCRIAIRGAGGNPGGELSTVIKSVTDSGHAVLGANATKTVQSRTVTDAVTTNRGTTVAAGSDGVVLSASSFTLHSASAGLAAAGWPSSGAFYVRTFALAPAPAVGPWAVVYYTGLSGGDFTGCTAQGGGVGNTIHTGYQILDLSLTSATLAAIAADIGSPLSGDNIAPFTTILNVVSGTQITLSQPAMNAKTGGSLTTHNGAQWSSDANNGLATGAMNLLMAAMNAIGGTIVIPGPIGLSQALRLGVVGQLSHAKIILDGEGAGEIHFLNSNSMGFIAANGMGASDCVPQLVRRGLYIDGNHQGYPGRSGKLDGIFKRQSSGFIDGIPHAWTSPAPLNFPLGAGGAPSGHGKPYELSTSVGQTTLVDTGRTVADLVTAGSTYIASAAAQFSDGSVGRTATGTNIPGGTTIASVISVLLTATAQTLDTTSRTLNVGSNPATAGFPSGGGWIAVQTTVGEVLAQYTGLSGNSFTGVTVPSGSYTTAVTGLGAVPPTVIGATLSQAATGSGTAGSLTLGAPSGWTLNGFAGMRLFIDEGKAVTNTPIGSGYATILGNTPDGVIVYEGLTGTKSQIGYNPSSPTQVTYRVLGGVWQGVDHETVDCTMVRSPSFLAQPTTTKYVDTVVEGCGGWGETSHNDTWGSSGTKASLIRITRRNCWGNIGDAAGTVPGLFPEWDVVDPKQVGIGSNGGLFICGVRTRIVSFSGENSVFGGGIGIDASTHPSNRGSNNVGLAVAAGMNVAGSGLNRLHGDSFLGNIAADSPWIQANGNNPTPTSLTFVSGTGQQIDQILDSFIVVPVTFTPTAGAAATCLVEMSYDGGATYTTIGSPISVPAGTALDSFVLPVMLQVQGGAMVRLTVTNATLGTGQRIF